MRTLILSVLAASATLGASALPAAAAYDYPYCLQSRQTGYPGDCSYKTYAQCQASASGLNAGCDVNPRVAFQTQRQQNGGYAPYSRGDNGFYNR